MNSFREISLLKTATLLSVFCSGIVVVMLMFGIYHYNRSIVIDRLQYEAKLITSELRNVIYHNMIRSDDETFRILASESFSDLNLSLFEPDFARISKQAILGRDGTILAHSHLQHIGSKETDETMGSLNSGKPTILQRSFLDSLRFAEEPTESYDIFLPFKIEEKLFGYFVVGVHAHTTDAEIFNLSIAPALAVVLIAALFVAFINSSFRRLVVQPIALALSQIEKIRSAGDLTIRISEKQFGELATLFRHFNTMLATLERSWAIILETHQSKTQRVIENTQEEMRSLTNRVSRHFENFNTIISNLQQSTHQLARSLETGVLPQQFQVSTGSYFPTIMTTPITPQGEALRFDLLLKMEKDLAAMFQKLPPLLSVIPKVTVAKKLAILAPTDIQEQIHSLLDGTPYEISVADEQAIDSNTDAKVLLLHESFIGGHVQRLKDLRAAFPHMRFLILADRGNPCLLIEGLKIGVRGAVDLNEDLPQHLEAIFDGEEVFEGRMAYNRSVALPFYDDLAPAVKEVFAVMFVDSSNRGIRREIGGAEGTVKRQVTDIYRTAGYSGREELMKAFQ